MFEPKQGYGHSYQRGLAEATGDLIVLSEPDGTFLPRDLVKLLAYSDDCDAVFGTRTTREMIWTGANMACSSSGKLDHWQAGRGALQHESLSDVGCTYRLITRETSSPSSRISGSAAATSARS